MTAYPTALHCARCGALDTAHELATDGRTRTRWLGQTAGSTGNVLCAGFVAGEVVEMVPEGELRRRLAAVLAVVGEESPIPPGRYEYDLEIAWGDGWDAALTAVAKAARGET